MSAHTVVDFRFRVVTPEFDASAAGAHAALWWNNRSTALWRHELEPSAAADRATTTLDECASWMRERGVLGVLPGRGMPGVAIPNDHLHDVCARYPDCFVALAGVDASRRRDAMDEIERCMRLGFVGVHLEPGWLRPPLAADAPALYPLYALCEDLRAIVVIHVGPLGGPGVAHTHPDAVAAVARDFPSMRIVIAHAGFPHVDAAVMCVFKHENVWLGPDPYHEFPGGALYRDWANRSDLVAERLLYGSSLGWPQAPGSLDRFVRLGWRDDVLERVLYRNAAALLGR